MSYNSRHTGSQIDEAVDKVLAIEPTAEEINEAINSIGNKVDKEEGKGLITDEEREQIWQNKNDIQDVGEDLESKANKDGRYPKLTSGFSENIVGDGSATEEMFSLRPTAGEERNVANTTYIDGERNEAARITAIKGSSVVMNQMVYNTDFAKDTEGWDVWGAESSNSEMLVNNGVLITRINVEGAYWGPRSRASSMSVNVGDKVLIISKFNFATNKGNTKVLSTYCSTAATKAFSYSQNVWHEAWSVETMTESGNPRFAVRVAEQSMGTIALAYLVAFNLTKMFGAGSEPATAEEFYQRIPNGVDVRADNEGKIINGHYKALLSTAFNQFNGTYARVCAGVRYHITGNITSLGFTPKEGGTLVDIALVDSKYTPSENGYIYATGNNICIHLCWAEYAHIEDMYEAYKPFVRDLSWVNNYFPEGMRSAGSVRDEIRYNVAEGHWEAVQRVGVVDLGTLQWQYSRTSGDMVVRLNSAKLPAKAMCSKYNYVAGLGNATTDKTLVLGENYYNLCILDSEYNSADSVAAFKNAMQGVMLNYELAEPIIAPITEEINLDYDCSDYGSEELISDGVSAPLVANIVYAPNALATLKQVPDILRRLAALEAKSVENINIEEL